MARLKQKGSTGVRIATRDARLKLPARREPYWVEVVPGTAVGYMRGNRDVSWFVRQRAAGKYVKNRLGTPDDHAPADGSVVLTYAQAVALATTQQLEKREARPRHYSDGVTLNDVVDAYFDEHLAGKGSETISRQLWARHGHDAIGTKLVTALDAPDLRKWHKALAAKPPTVRGKAQAFDPADPKQLRARRATANRILTIAKAALNYAWRGHSTVKLPDTLPTWWVKVEPFPLGDAPPPRMLDQQEVKRLLNAAAPDLRSLLSGALMTGGRRGELVGLKVRNYLPERSAIILRQSKTGKTLIQPLTPEGVDLFDTLTAGRDANAIIFQREDGTPWARDAVTKPMAAAVAGAKLDEVSFKTTRATYGKLLLLATKDIEIVAKALGHSDSRITRQHYAQYLPNEVADGVAKMPKLGLVKDSKVTRFGKRKAA